MLLGRPILERLQAVVDFGGGRMKIMGGAWRDIERGKQGSMLLSLCSHLLDASQLDTPTFDLRSEDDHGQVESFDDFLKDMRAEGRFEEMKTEIEDLAEEAEHAIKVEGVEKTVESLERLFTCCEMQLQDLKKKQKQMMNEARPGAHSQEEDRVGDLCRSKTLHAKVFEERC